MKPRLFIASFLALLLFFPKAYCQNSQAEINKLEKGNSKEKIEAAAALGKYSDKASGKALLSGLKKEKNPYVKGKIVEALGARKDRDVLPEILKIAESDPDEDSRNSAVRSLAYAADESVVPSLIAKFRDEKEKLGIRLQAANSLASYPREDVFDVFVKALEDENVQIKKQAVVSLYNGFGWDKKRIIPHMEKMAKDKATEAIAKQYLKNLGEGK